MFVVIDQSYSLADAIMLFATESDKEENEKLLAKWFEAHEKYNSAVRAGENNRAKALHLCKDDSEREELMRR